MPKRSPRKKKADSSGPTVLVSYRLRRALHEQLEARAKATGMSAGGFAREATLQKLAQAGAEERGVLALHALVETLRREMALATRAILTVSKNPVTPEQAAEWVRKNLNR